MIHYLLYKINYIYLAYPVQCIILCIAVAIIGIIYCFKKISLSTDYKMYYSSLDWLYISIYILLYIIMVIILRYFAWGNPINLTMLLDIVKDFILKHGIPFSLLILSLWAFLIVLLTISRNFLIKEIKKRHIYLSYTYPMQEINYAKFCEFGRQFAISYFIVKTYGMDQKVITKIGCGKSLILSGITPIQFKKIISYFQVELVRNNLYTQEIGDVSLLLVKTCENLTLHQITWASRIHLFTVYIQSII